MRYHVLGLSLLSAVSLHAGPYVLGQGYQLNDMLNVGGYFSSQYEIKDSEQSLIAPDDIAVMAYGDVNPMISYLAEFEAAGFYHKNLSTGDESGDRKFHIERLYGDLWLADAYNIRFGKQITPIGYWNTEPINVLRNTSSNPLYAMRSFPKFLTGIDINGYIPGLEGARYHLFGQNNKDLDEQYINIPNTHFYGLSVEKEISNDWSAGGSVGEYITTVGNQRSRFVQANAKYDDTTWQVMAEALVAKSEYVNHGDDYTLSSYVQAWVQLSTALSGIPQRGISVALSKQ